MDKEILTDEIIVAEVDEIDKLRDDLAEMSDKYVRAMAEVENVRRRSAIDAESMLRARAIGVAEKFIPLIDAIDAARKHAPDDDGIATLAAAAANALTSVGIVKIETVGQQLNPAFHNAVATTDDGNAGIIVEEFQPGYMFGDTVIRPAMVVVAK